MKQTNNNLFRCQLLLRYPSKMEFKTMRKVTRYIQPFQEVILILNGPQNERKISYLFSLLHTIFHSSEVLLFVLTARGYLLQPKLLSSKINTWLPLTPLPSSGQHYVDHERGHLISRRISGEKWLPWQQISIY